MNNLNFREMHLRSMLIEEGRDTRKRRHNVSLFGQKLRRNENIAGCIVKEEEGCSWVLIEDLKMFRSLLIDHEW